MHNLGWHPRLQCWDPHSDYYCWGRNCVSDVEGSGNVKVRTELPQDCSYNTTTVQETDSLAHTYASAHMQEQISIAVFEWGDKGCEVKNDKLFFLLSFLWLERQAPGFPAMELGSATHTWAQNKHWLTVPGLETLGTTGGKRNGGTGQISPDQILPMEKLGTSMQIRIFAQTSAKQFLMALLGFFSFPCLREIIFPSCLESGKSSGSLAFSKSVITWQVLSPGMFISRDRSVV